MIEIEGPDGVIYEFPAGTDDGTISAAMQKVYGAPQQPAAPEPVPAPQPPAPEAAPYDLRAEIQRDMDAYNDRQAKIGTWINRAGESATLGLVGDEASAAVTGLLPGRSYEGELDRYRQNEEDLGAAGRLSADLAGALIPGAGAAGVIGKAGTLAGRIGRGAVAGGAGGASYGFMEGEGGFDERKGNAGTQALIGAMIGGAIPAAGAGIRSVANSRAGRKAVAEAGRGAPSSEELRALGRDLYRQVDEAGVQIKPESFNRAKDEIRDYLRTHTGYDELPGPGSLTPNTARVMSIMDDAGARMAQEPTAALPFRSIDQMRRQAGAAAGNVTNKADQQAGMSVIERLDDFVQRLGADDVVAGNPEALKSGISKAREVWGRMSRSQMIDDAIEQSENYLGGGASGVRNQLAKMLRNPKQARAFSEAEKTALRGALRGGIVEQAIGLAGGGIGRIAQAGIGATTGGLGGAAAGVVGGQVARNASEAMAMKSLERVRAAIASGQLRNPEVTALLANAGKRPERLTNTALLSALLAGQSATP